jgi:hypothetical protein
MNHLLFLFAVFISISAVMCGSMYGMTDFSFVQVNMDTGAITKYFDNPAYFSSDHTGAAAVDQKNGIFYLIGASNGYTSLLGIDLKTSPPSIKYLTRLPIQGGIEEAGAYIGIDQSTSTIYVAGDRSRDHALYTVTPTNNRTTLVATWTHGTGILGIGGSTYDAKNKIFLVQFITTRH